MTKDCPECGSNTTSREIPEAEWLRVECSCGWHKYYDLPVADKVEAEYQQEVRYL